MKDVRCITLDTGNILSFSHLLGDTAVQYIRKPACFGYGAVIEDTVAGVILLEAMPEEKAAAVLYFYVEEEYRRQGVGKMLLSEAKEAAMLRELSQLTVSWPWEEESLTLFLRNEEGAAFYLDEETPENRIAVIPADDAAAEALFDGDRLLISMRPSAAEAVVKINAYADILTEAGFLCRRIGRPEELPALRVSTDGLLWITVSALWDDDREAAEEAFGLLFSYTERFSESDAEGIKALIKNSEEASDFISFDFREETGELQIAAGLPEDGGSIEEKLLVSAVSEFLAAIPKPSYTEVDMEARRRDARFSEKIYALEKAEKRKQLETVTDGQKEVALAVLKLSKDPTFTPERPTGYEWSMPPGPIEGESSIVQKLASLVVVNEKLKSEPKTEPAGLPLHEQAKAIARDSFKKALSGALIAWFSSVGISMDGSEVSGEEQRNAAKLFPERLRRYQFCMIKEEELFHQSLSKAAKNAEAFLAVLAKEREALEKADEEKKAALLARIKNGPYTEENEKTIARVSAEKDKTDQAIRELLGLHRAYAAWEDTAAYAKALSALTENDLIMKQYISESLELYLLFLSEKAEVDAMHGSYILDRFHVYVNALDTTESVWRYIGMLDQRLAGLEDVLQETDGDIPAAYSLMHEGEAAVKEGALSERLASLKAKLAETPALSGELSLWSIFSFIPEHFALYDEARSVRDGYSALCTAEQLLSLSEEKRAALVAEYIEASAIWDTIETHTKRISHAGRLPMEALVGQQNDFVTTSYAFCYKEAEEYVTNRIHYLEAQHA